MKRKLNVFIAVGGLVLLSHLLDLMFWTDLDTGLPIYGSVWLRYLSVAAAFAVPLLGCFQMPKGSVLLSQSRLCSGLCYGVFAGFLLCIGTEFLFAPATIPNVVQLLLRIPAAIWFFTLGRYFSAPEWKRPWGGAVLAVGGGSLFYFWVLRYFMQNNSSYYRTAPTMAVMAALSLLVFLSILARCVLLPGENSRRALCRSSLWAFYFGFCWQGVQTLFLLLTGRADTMQLTYGLSAALVGLLGAACARQGMCR